MELRRSTGYASVPPRRQFCWRSLPRTPFSVVRPPAKYAVSNDAQIPDRNA
jgi:hypothetical protein